MSEAFPVRGSVRGTTACAAADHPLAAAVGMAVLRDGGSAADAAVAMGTVMTVVQPQFSHLGGDVFALTFEAATGEVRALNSSGPAPRSSEAQAYRDMGGIPEAGPLAVTVPGAVDGWWRLHQAGGRLPWKRLLEPAIGYAREGFPASRGLALAMDTGRERVYPSGAFKETFGGVAGEGGQAVTQPALARTLEAVAAGGPAAFYEGAVARECMAALNGRGACFTAEDWQPPGRWEEPLAVRFGGYRVHSQPPPSQGFALLLSLTAYERMVAGDGGHTAAPLLQVRAAVAAFDARTRLAADPDGGRFDARALLRDEAVTAMVRDPARASLATVGDGDTTYLLAVDAQGNAVSLIQSLFAAWGSGVYVPATGVFMNNRMCGFRLKVGHPNELAGGRRPNHTLHSWLATIDPPELLPLARKVGERPAAARLRAVGGTPGADRQVQTNLQLLDALLREGMDPQAAIDRPRWSIGTPAGGGEVVEVETRERDELGELFRRGGLEVRPLAAWGATGKAYVALLEPGKIAVGADLRGEGQALVC
ncbi:MAG: gamma-glutamyltransferase family protein [Tepidiformaceae bacterium]